jgi:carbon-monoxide dehydrogenase medium subunit
VHVVQVPGVRVRRHETPGTLEEALGLLAEHGPAARVIAGGTDLLLELARRVRPEVEVLVDLTRIAGLDTISLADGVLSIGPLVTHNQVIASEEVVRHALPLAQASLELGAPALRNRATVAGNLVTASPANDTITALWALGAEVVLRSAATVRRVPVRQLYTGVRRTVLEPGEILTAIEVPVRSGARGVFVKLGQRRAQAISIVHVAAVVSFDGDTATEVHLALGSVAPTVVSAIEAEAVLVGTRLDDDHIAEAARLAAAGVRPIDDVRATADYRSEEIEVMVQRALRALRDGQERAQWPTAPVCLAGSPPETATTGAAFRASHDRSTPVECTVNGRSVSAADAAGRTLLDWLREEVGLTGTKEGCAEGECGACTVHLDGKAVLACLVPAARAHGSTVTTIEGLAEGDALHPLQEAFVDEFAVQCGFCIPGFLMAGDRLLHERPQPSREEIAQGLSGNLCRCTGYYRFYDAIERAARP